MRINLWGRTMMEKHRGTISELCPGRATHPCATKQCLGGGLEGVAWGSGRLERECAPTEGSFQLQPGRSFYGQTYGYTHVHTDLLPQLPFSHTDGPISIRPHCVWSALGPQEELWKLGALHLSEESALNLSAETVQSRLIKNCSLSSSTAETTELICYVPLQLLN